MKQTSVQTLDQKTTHTVNVETNKGFYLFMYEQQL